MANVLSDIWFHVKKCGEDECWLFIGAYTKDGYGRFTANNRRFLAHVAAFESIHSRKLPGSIILHSCNNPPCCNPKHLSEGTYSENQQYALKSGTRKPGSSGVIGVHYDKIKSKWIAYAKLNGTQYNLYQGKDFEAACKARRLFDERLPRKPDACK